MFKRSPLTPEEENIILHKGTQAPFTGKYTNFDGRGVYFCRQCTAPLYRSLDKFSSQCGWPSFDDEITGQVTRYPDPDGRRVEIVCTQCKGHLGHVFLGEKLTKKNCRHCVNSLSLMFLDFDALLKLTKEFPAKYDSVCVAGGCFWGVEKQLSEIPGVLSTRVGYTGGHLAHPTYEDVCGKKTRHAEAVQAIIWLDKLSLEEFYYAFFLLHDPSQHNRQGADIGDQYRSAIFYRDENQKKVAEKVIEKLKSTQKVVTTLELLNDFWEAESYHQCYFKRS